MKEDLASLLEQCNWPQLPERYDRALREAVRFIFTRFDDVLGIVVSGTILRGTASPTSDLDISVIHAQPWRQRLQRLFEGVPAEIFVNPPSKILKYFQDERHAGRPVTAHMWTTGHIVFDKSPKVSELQALAREVLERPPAYDCEQLTGARYRAAFRYEDATDVVNTHPVTANMILATVVYDMIRYHFMARSRYLPRDKDLLRALDDLDPDLSRLTRAFYGAVELDERLALAEEIARCTIQTHGFFEWESEPEDVE